MEEINYKKGERVKIRSGATIRSTYPGRKQKTASRTQVVTVHHTLPRQTVSISEALNEFRDRFDAALLARFDQWRLNNAPEFYRERAQIEGPKVCWVGTGGYWHEVSVDEIELA